MDKLYQNDAKYDRTEVTELRFVKQGFEFFFFLMNLCYFSFLILFLFFAERAV